MIFTETRLPGAFTIEPELREDHRGSFALAWSKKEFARRGLNSRVVESNLSINTSRGTLRGMHFQLAPYAQARLVRCTAGVMYDVIIDLREGSPTFKQWAAVTLSAANRLMLYVPEGFAHGFQTLEDNTEVFYQMSEIYSLENSRGVRWDDPAFVIEWPEVGERVINERDRTWPLFLE